MSPTLVGWATGEPGRRLRHQHAVFLEYRHPPCTEKQRLRQLIFGGGWLARPGAVRAQWTRREDGLATSLTHRTDQTIPGLAQPPVHGILNVHRRLHSDHDQSH